MPYQVSIPIVNNSDCVSFYKVEYKKSTETQYKVVDPNPVSSPIWISPLDDCTTYNIRITKRCCNGQNSPSVSIDITTGGDCETT